MQVRSRLAQTSIGWIIAVESDGAISELRIVQSPTGNQDKNCSSELIANLFEQLEEYLGGERKRFDVPYRLDAPSRFSLDVLTELTLVGFGKTISYGELASRAGYPGAARAVGNVLNRNPLLILIPCHRVITANGKLGGFGSGLQCKRALHEIEGIGPLE